MWLIAFLQDRLAQQCPPTPTIEMLSNGMALNLNRIKCSHRRVFQLATSLPQSWRRTTNGTSPTRQTVHEAIMIFILKMRCRCAARRLLCAQPSVMSLGSLGSTMDDDSGICKVCDELIGIGSKSKFCATHRRAHGCIARLALRGITIDMETKQPMGSKESLAYKSIGFHGRVA